ncbi:MAG: signal recognition particle protein [Chloroflexi bacterium]|nr:MAG: signal recognition particle protein [Chloroflexota bacterium]
MFESLSDKLQETFANLGRKGKLNEADVDAAMRNVRLALLEADVNYKVVRDFVKRVKERAIGAEVMKSLTPAQQVVKIVNEELVELLGEAERLDLSGQPPHVIMLVGLQGSGKTTTAAKLALQLRKNGHKPLLVAADTRRPAAIEQLEALGRQLDIPVHSEGTKVPPPVIAENAVREARRGAYSVVLIDTGGRLNIDEELMQELSDIKERVHPTEILLVADAMTGQEAVRVAQDFHERVGLTGLILTKIDGDARGGAALSMRAVTGVPIKYIGVGERTDQLEPFYPDRMASRILGMGDMLSLIERAEQAVEEEEARKAAEKFMRAEFDLSDFLNQLQQIKKMGPLDELMKMIPGFAQIQRQMPVGATDEQLKVIEAIIYSMTPEERRNPKIINASRKRRIARGSGTTVQQVNELLNQFRQVQRLMKQMQKGRGPLGMFGRMFG